MEAIKELFSRVNDSLFPLREEISIAFLAFLLAILAYNLINRRILRRNPDEMGMRIVEELDGQTLVKVRNPGNIRAISRTIPQSQSVMIRFMKMEQREFRYAISLLKKFGEMRGVAVIKVDEGLFLVRGSDQKDLSFAGRGAQIIDFQGSEVTPE